MKINEILECFNKVLDQHGNPDKVHYVAYDNIERRIGAVKTASTIITLVGPKGTKEEIIREEYTSNMPKEYENALLEETERMALVKFIEKWTNDTRTW